MKKGQVIYAPLEDQKEIVVLSKAEYEAMQNRLLYWVKRASRSETFLRTLGGKITDELVIASSQPEEEGQDG